MFQFIRSSFSSVIDYTFGRNRKRKPENNMSPGDGLPVAKKALTNTEITGFYHRRRRSRYYKDGTEDSNDAPGRASGDLPVEREASIMSTNGHSSSFAQRALNHDNTMYRWVRPSMRSPRRSSFYNSESVQDQTKTEAKDLHTTWYRNSRESNATGDTKRDDTFILTRHFEKSCPSSGLGSSSLLRDQAREQRSQTSNRLKISSTRKYPSLSELLDGHTKPPHSGRLRRSPVETVVGDSLPSTSDRLERPGRVKKTPSRMSNGFESSSSQHSSSKDDDDVVVTGVEISQKSCQPKAADFEKLMQRCRYIETDWLQASKRRSQRIVEDNCREADALNTVVKECESKRALWDSYLSKRALRYLRLTSYEPTPIPDIYVEPVVEDVTELPPVTEAMVRRVQNALTSNPNTILSEGFRLQVTTAELATLRPRQWLSDMVINFYMQLIAERSTHQEGMPTSYAMTTFFYPKLRQAGYAGVRRWTRKVDIFSYDFVLVPIHLGQHWCFAFLQMKDMKISYFDSMQQPNNECLSQLLQYLVDELKEKKGETLNVNEWSVENAKNIPVQRNGYDCGVFTCQFAEFLSRGAALTFKQGDMNYFRDRMMYEILEKKLLI